MKRKPKAKPVSPPAAAHRRFGRIYKLAMAAVKSPWMGTVLVAALTLTFHQCSRNNQAALWDYTSGLHKEIGAPPVPATAYKP